MKKSRIGLSVLILLFISACSNDSIKVDTEFIKQVPFPETTEVFHQESLTNGEVVLYQDKSGFRMGFLPRISQHWLHTGNISLNPLDGFDWGMSNNPTIPVVMFAGVITDDNIDHVIIKQNTNMKEAKVIDIGDGNRQIWFVTFDRLKDSEPNEPSPLKIEAYTKDGKLFWRDGVYKDGYKRGVVAD